MRELAAKLESSGDKAELTSSAVIPMTSPLAAGPSQLAPDIMVGAPPRIHLIEDDPEIRWVARYLFERADWNVSEYISAEEFLAGWPVSGECCLVIDVNLPGMSGIDLLEWVHRENSIVPAVMLTGRKDAAAAVAVLKAGAADYLEKPADPALLMASIVRAVKISRGPSQQTLASRRTEASQASVR